jgi:Holliday junction resolvase
MARPDAIELVTAASEGALSREIGEALVDAVGGQPFYLQVLGDELLRDGPPFDRDAVKHTLQRTLFSRTGRLGLYFERLHSGLVGRSGHAAAVLGALAASAEGSRLSDLARAVGAPTGDTARYLERLGDAVSKESGRWRLVDAAFRLWLAWREPHGTVVPMTVLGDEAEKATAAALASMGFDLVYQSRASRGAFDLLATRGAALLGVQVKRARLPLAIPREAWLRMEAEASRFGWRWVVAAVQDGGVTFLAPGLARVQRTARLDASATIPNLLAWLDASDETSPGGQSGSSGSAHS